MKVILRNFFENFFQIHADVITVLLFFKVFIASIDEENENSNQIIVL